MYALNKIVGYIVSPLGFTLLLALLAGIGGLFGKKGLARWAAVLSFVNLWFWSMPLISTCFSPSLECDFLIEGKVPPVETLPNADLIELHGGSMSVATNIGYQAEMWSGADRVWHAVHLWKAGKAPKILVTAPDSDLSTGGLLADFGVPKESIVFDLEPRNTEEEAKAVVRFFERSELSVEGRKPRVLVVTSAWHMKRTLLMYQKFAPEIEAIPAPCDFENSLTNRNSGGWVGFLPTPQALAGNSYNFHEWLGRMCYRFLR